MTKKRSHAITVMKRTDAVNHTTVVQADKTLLDNYILARRLEIEQLGKLGKHFQTDDEPRLNSPIG